MVQDLKKSSENNNDIILFIDIFWNILFGFSYENFVLNWYYQLYFK